MNNFDVISTPTFSGFIAEVAAGGRAVRLCLGELYDPERYGSGGQTFTVPAKRITLDLQGFNDEKELIWLSRSLTVHWGDEGPAMSDDRDRYNGMNELRRIVLARLEALGYEVRPGRYVLPKGFTPSSDIIHTGLEIFSGPIAFGQSQLAPGYLVRCESPSLTALDFA